jgi:hypothetical protein
MISQNEYRVLSRLTYIDYEKGSDGNINEQYKGLSLKDLQIDKLFISQSNETYSKWESEIDKIKNDWKIIEYQNNNEFNGFVGVAFQNVNTDEIVVGF